MLIDRSKTEGYRGHLQRLLDFSFQVVSGVATIPTRVRHMLDGNGIKDTKVKALVGGSCASVVGRPFRPLRCISST